MPKTPRTSATPADTLGSSQRHSTRKTTSRASQPTQTLPEASQSVPDPVVLSDGSLCDAEYAPQVPEISSSLLDSLQADRDAVRQDIIQKVKSQSTDLTASGPHIIVKALAGTGKTTTLVEGLKRVKGIQSNLQPSPQQAAVWASMALSAGKVNSICFCAFNKSIATELQQRMPTGCEAMTLHSLGNKAVSKAFGRLTLNQYRVEDIISYLMGLDIYEIRRKHGVLLNATKALVSLCKQNLTGLGLHPDNNTEWEVELDALAEHYDVELNGSRERVYRLVPAVLEACKDVSVDRKMDFDDMVWLPVALDLPCYRYDLLLVDECQDLNKCQQQLALKSGRRIVLCGDEKQAIYGFAGADAESMHRMEGILGETEAGCVVLPLTVTRRCGKAIVAEAQKIVPSFAAFETNGEGSIAYADFEEKSQHCYQPQVQDGDFVLCRVNAPLVSQCFRFLKAGRKANIQGRDIGAGLIKTIQKLMKGRQTDTKVSVVDLIGLVDDWYDTEVKKVLAKRNPNDQQLMALGDRRECLTAFCDNAGSVDDVLAKIAKVFSDENTTGIKLSSIHRAKGLEADRVFLLEPEGATVPHPMARSVWQREQEMNLRYVAITRAKTSLTFVR